MTAISLTSTVSGSSPRARGTLEGYGSSPRARGTPSSLSRQDRRHRFIPAGAGNTPNGMLRHIPGAVHPRGRGEHGGLPSGRGDGIGSSPRARGTHERVVIFWGAIRFIPAGAGNTRYCRRSRSHRPVHPRGRGEHAADPSGPLNSVGSSPRARGTPVPVLTGSEHRRFIPAGAGNTLPVTICCKFHLPRRNVLPSLEGSSRGMEMVSSC